MMQLHHFGSSPYPGLRPFETEESHIFFGREEQTDELLSRLQTHHFIAVIGPSGCGKSSLVRAGMIAALRTGFMSDAGPNWRIVQMRPGDRPIGKLAEALLDPALVGQDRARHAQAPVLVESALRRGPLSIVELARESNLCSGANLLILVDQFEELFRFRKRVDPNEADAFVGLLLATAAQRELPIYIVITMRSDFLGDCALFQGLPEAINNSQYLTPRLTREQCAKAIRGPARVFDGDVDDKLLNRLLNDFGPDPDQLPVLQHALMRMWQCRSEKMKEPGSRVMLTMECYDSVGGLKEALSRHADETLGELTAEQQRIAEILFRRLTERGEGKRDTRSPASVQEVLEIAGVGMGDLQPVVDTFRRGDRSFIAPRGTDPIRSDTVLDIGHESLIRLWDRLGRWVNEESDSARIYAHLKETADLWQRGQAALWGTPDLENALNWMEKNNPSQAWARRYGSQDKFELAMKFLNESRSEHERLKREAERVAQLKMRRSHFITIGAAVAIAVSFLVLVYYYGWISKSPSYYNSFVRIRGVPTGVGKLTADQVKHRSTSIRIIRRGEKGPVIRMEAVDREGKYTTHHDVGTYLEDRTGDGESDDEVRWDYSYDESGRVVQEDAFNKHNKRVWGFVYLPQHDMTGSTRIGYYVGPEGYPKSGERYSGSVVQITYDQYGYDSVVRYLSRNHHPVRGLDKAFGRRYLYDDEGNVIQMTSLGPDDKPLNDSVGNAILERKNINNFGQVTLAVMRDDSGRITNIIDGYAITRVKYDESGNIVEQAYYDSADKPTQCNKGYHKITWDYDGHGNMIKGAYQDTAGRPTAGGEGYFSWKFEYNEKDERIRSITLDMNDKPCFDNSGYAIRENSYYDDHNIKEIRYYNPQGNLMMCRDGYAIIRYRYDGNNGKVIETAYFSPAGSPILTKSGYSVLKNIYDDQGHLTVQKYLDTLGLPIQGPSGYAIRELKYDEFGNTVQCKYFDFAHRPIVTSNNMIAGWESRFDANNREIEVTFIDGSDRPMFNDEGVAGYRVKYDEMGNEVVRRYYGLHEEPYTISGAAGYNTEYDFLGNEVRRTYVDMNERKVRHSDGYAYWKKKYDHCGNESEISFYDEADRPIAVLPDSTDKDDVIHGEGARRTLKYNAQNRVIEAAYYGTDGKLMMTSGRWARAIIGYDEAGNQISREYYDTRGKRVRGKAGVSRYEWKYNQRGQVLSTHYYDEHDKPTVSMDGYASFTRKYDIFANNIEYRLFGTDGKPVMVDGVSLYRYEFDSHGRVVRESYFGSTSQQEKVLNASGIHSIVYRRNHLGKVEEEEFFGIDGKPAAYQGKLTKIVNIYNERDQHVRTDGFLYGKRLPNSIFYRYDSIGRQIKYETLPNS